MKSYFCIGINVILLFFCSNAIAQKSLIHLEADSLRQLGQYKLSSRAYQQAVIDYRAQSDLPGQFESLCNILDNTWRLGQYDRALKLADSILIQSEISFGSPNLYQGTALANKGTIYITKSNFDSALYNARKSLEIRRQLPEDNPALMASTYNLLGGIFSQMDYHDSSEYYMLKALNIAKEQFGEEHRYTAIITNNLGAIYHNFDNEKSIEFLNHVIRIYSKQLGEDHPALCYPYLNLGVAHFNLGQYQESIPYYSQSMRIAKNNFGEEHYNYVQVVNNLGNTYIRLENYDTAKTFFQRSIPLFNKVLGANNHRTADVYLSLGKLEARIGNQDSAMFYFNKAVKHYKNSIGDKYAELSSAYMNISGHFMDNNDSRQALQYVQKAISALILDFNDTNPNKNPSVVSSLDDIGLLECLNRKAEIYFSLYKQTDSIEYLAFADETYELCLNWENMVSKTFNYKTYSTSIGDVFDKVTRGAVLTKVEMPSISNQKEAFKFSESNKVLLLRKNSADQMAKRNIKISDDLLATDIKLRQELSFYQSLVLKEKAQNESQDTLKLIGYENNLFELKRQHEQFIKRLEENHPEYYNLKYNSTLASIEDVQNELLEEHQSLLEYFIGDSIIYIFVINKNSHQIKTVNKELDLATKIAALNAAIKTDNLANYSQLAYELYQLLYQPIESFVAGNDIVIVPDGALWYLNFELLISDLSNSTSYKELRYLIRDYTFSYAYSSTLLLQEKNRKLVQQDGLLAFSYGQQDSEMGNAMTLRSITDARPEDLPGSRKEIRMISETFGGKYYYGSFANEQNFKAHAKEYAFLHLALHGFIDEESPNNSLLYFASEGDSIEDGRLYIHELYQMELNAELAVLSACNTGTGRLFKGEGIMSLGRAFTYAGCKSLVLTLWELNDAISPAIMQNFYQNLNEGMKKSEALRRAKLAHLERADNIKANPFFWGSFVLVGNSNAISKNSYKDYIAYGIVLFILMLFAVMLWRRKSTS